MRARRNPSNSSGKRRRVPATQTMKTTKQTLAENQMTTVRSWMLNYFLPHVIVGALGGIGTVVFPQTTLKLVALFGSIAATFGLLFRRYALALLKRLWRLAT